MSGARRIVALGWRLVLAVTASTVLVMELGLSPGEFHVHAPRSGSAATEQAGPEAMSAEADTAADPAVILAQPLFYPTRRPWLPPPPPVRPPVVITPPPLTGYSLAGVIGSGTTRSAIIRPARNGGTIVLVEGSKLDGWTLQEISRDRLRFVASGASYEMMFPKPSQSQR